MVKIITTLIAASALSGCIGIYTKGEVEADMLWYSPTSAALLTERGFLAYEPGRPAEKRITKAQLTDHWGPPNKVRKLENGEDWYYRRELGFSGLILGLIVPVPLLVPAGYRPTIFHFKDEELLDIHYMDSGLTHAYGCTYGITGHGYEFMCATE